MPDHLSERELTDLGRDVARQADPPPFSDLVRRARRRRTNRLLASAAATAVVLGAVGIGLMQPDGARRGADPVDNRPLPTQRTEAPEPDAHHQTIDVNEFLADERTRMLTLAANPGGDVLAVYRRCEPGCRSAYVRRTGDGWTYAAMFPRRQQPYDVYPLDEGFLLEGPGLGAGLVIDASGTDRATARSEGGPVMAGDIGVEYRFDAWFARTADDGDVVLFPAPTPSADYVSSDAAVDDRGTVYLFSGDHAAGAGQSVRLSSREAGGDGWTSREMDEGATAIPGKVYVNGPHVVAFSTYDGATIAPVGRLLLSSDHGRTWTELHRRDVPFQDIANLAVTDDGAIFISEEGRDVLWRGSTATGAFDAVPFPGDAQGIVDIVTSGPLVYLVTYTEETGASVLVSRDSGESWQPVDLP